MIVSSLLKGSNNLIIPSTFLVASAISFYYPQYSFSILFGLIGITILFVEDIIESLYEPITKLTLSTTTKSLNTFANKQNLIESNKLLQAIANVISRCLDNGNSDNDDNGNESNNNSPLQTIIKQSFVSILSDKELHIVILTTIQNAIIQASNDEHFRSTLLDVTKK